MNSRFRQIASMIILTAGLLTVTVEAGQNEAPDKLAFSIVARQRLDSVAVQPREFSSMNLTRTIKAKEGAHLELFRVTANANWKDGSGKTLYTEIELSYPGEEEPVECAGCAERNTAGVFEKDNSFQLVLRWPYEKEADALALTKDFVFFVPDNAPKLTFKVIESKSEKEHILQIPEQFSQDVSYSTPKINVSVLSSEHKEKLATSEKISYAPAVEAATEWTLTSGQFLLVNAKVQPDISIPAQIKTVTIHPEEFSIKLPDGSAIQSIGSLASSDLEDGSYPFNLGRNNDGTWPSAGGSDGMSLVFIVPRKLEAFELVYMPR